MVIFRMKKCYLHCKISLMFDCVMIDVDILQVG